MTPEPAAVPDGWQVVRLGDVAEVVGGTTPSRANELYWGGDVPWVVPSELTGLQGRYLDTSREFITNQGLKASGLRVLPAGSVLLTSRATIGATAINSVPVTTNQGFQNLVGMAGVHGLWLYYCVSATRHELQKRSAGSTFREISRDGVRSLPILLPPLAEQRAIAAVLDAIDEAIERTEEVIAATERLRDALLHELLTRGLRGRHSEWADVPGLGTVPACWDVVRLGEVATVRNGTTPSRSRVEYWEGGDVPFIRTGRVNDVSIEEPDEFITSRAVESAGAVVVPAGSVLIAMIGQGKTRGKTGRLRFDAAINQNFAAIYDTADELSLEFVFLWARHNYLAIRNRGQGTNQDALNCDLIESLRLPRPPVAEQDEIADSVSAISEREAVEGQLLRELRHAKAATADALLTGRVRVRLDVSV